MRYLSCITLSCLFPVLVGCEASADLPPRLADPIVGDAGAESWENNDRCYALGGSCAYPDDCCAGMVCSDGVCERDGDPGCGFAHEGCDSAADCCNGFECSEVEGCCAPETRPCSASSDCCTGLSCVDGACAPPSGCLDVTQSCSDSGECCTGMKCSNATSSCCWEDGQAYRFSELECCSGTGVDGVCGSSCGRSGESCEAPSDCCMSERFQCSAAGTCCGHVGSPCTDSEGCCDGLTCDGGACAVPTGCNDVTQGCGGTLGDCCGNLACSLETFTCCWEPGVPFRFSDLECCSGSSTDGVCN